MESTQGRQAVLMDDQREKFERDGYLVFDPEVPFDVIDRITSELGPKYPERGTHHEGEVIYQPGRITYAWRISENVRRVATAPKVLRSLGELYGRRMMPFQTLNFRRGTQQSPHSDAMHFRPAEPTQMCGVWVAFEDIHEANGPLVYFPGSHKLPFVNYEDVGFEAKESDFPSYDKFIHQRNWHYQQYVANLLEQHALQPEFGTLGKGQALIWASNLIHGGAPQEDKEYTRHSQVTHYLPEDSFAYHTPMRMEGDREYWTEPEMVLPLEEAYGSA
jgi:ectoine hydroxylase-related dioxygenase (phytanoyl-CoA dioxygenase family)